MKKENKKIVCYHLFGDNWDEYYSTRKEADEAYKREVIDSEGKINLRLYKEISLEDEQEVEEVYIKGRGGFPW